LVFVWAPPVPLASGGVIGGCFGVMSVVFALQVTAVFSTRRFWQNPLFEVFLPTSPFPLKGVCLCGSLWGWPPFWAFLRIFEPLGNRGHFTKRTPHGGVWGGPPGSLSFPPAGNPLFIFSPQVPFCLNPPCVVG